MVSGSFDFCAQRTMYSCLSHNEIKLQIYERAGMASLSSRVSCAAALGPACGPCFHGSSHRYASSHQCHHLGAGFMRGQTSTA